MAERRRGVYDTDEMIARVAGMMRVVQGAGTLMSAAEYERIESDDASDDVYLRVMTMKGLIGQFEAGAMGRAMDGTLAEGVCRTLVDMSKLDWIVEGRFESGATRGRDLMLFLSECGRRRTGLRMRQAAGLNTAEKIIEAVECVLTFYEI